MSTSSPDPRAATPRRDLPELVLAGIIGVSRSRLVIAPASGGEALVDITGEGSTPGAVIEQKLDRLVRTAHRAAEMLPGGDEHAAPGTGQPPRILAAALAVHGLARTEADQAQQIGRTLMRAFGTAPEKVVVGDDLLASFLAGEVGDSGVLLRAGTGSVGVRFEERRRTARRDGMGQLLGDIGSAVWIGRRTLQVVAADIDDRGPRTALTEKVGDMLDLDLRDGLIPPSPTGDVRDDLSRAIALIAPPIAPAELGRFAPLPGTVPEDPAARDILDTVMRHFAESVRRLDPQAELPVVLAGSVLATPGPIHDELVTGFEAEGRLHREQVSGITGALALARERAADGA